MSTERMELLNKVTEQISQTIDDLHVIWDEIGIDNETKKRREVMFLGYVDELMKDMKAEAVESKRLIYEEIDCLLNKIKTLSRDLNEKISVDEYNNQPLYFVRNDLTSKIERYEKIYYARKKEITNLLKKQDELCQTLGKPGKDIEISPLPSAETLLEFEQYLDKLTDMKFEREELFFNKKMAIIEIMNELNIKPCLDFERKIVLEDESVFQLSDENMACLENLYLSLKTQLQDTKDKIAELREQISALWERLEESPQVRSEFLASYPGNSIDTLQALRAEKIRCDEKKKANIKIFVDKMRQELVDWWDKCRFSTEQRTEFIHFESDCYTEDLLTLHEMEVEKIKTHYENNKTIYELYSKREKLWEKMKELESRSARPDRYKNRGGQLLREEKDRKAIACQLPKTEKEILDLVNNYEAETGVLFLINGERVSDLFDQAWEEYKENKHLKLSARKHVRDKTTLTPSVSHQTLALSTGKHKRKLATPLFNESKRCRVIAGNIKTAPPKLLVNGSTIKRVSLERRRRMERQKRRSNQRLDKSATTTISDYDGFETIPLAHSTVRNEAEILNGLANKSTCRSSLFPEKLQLCKTAVCGTPRRALEPLNNTPQRTTPRRLNVRSKSPMTASRLVAAPDKLPVIF